MADAIVMEGDLSALLAANSVHADLIEKFRAARCTKVQLLAHWFDAPEEIKGWVHSVASTKDDIQQNASLKCCVEKAKELTKASIARAALGMADMPVDEPLPAEQHRNMMSVATALYRWVSIDNRTICNDTQMAKFRREFQAWQPSMHVFAKVKTLAQSQKAHTVMAKRQKIGEGVSLQFGSSAEDGYANMDIVTWPMMFQVIVKSWAAAGAYDVPEQKDSAKEIKMCEFAHADAYRLEFVAKIKGLRERYVDGSIVKALSTTEEAFRSRAIELCRSEQHIPWGLALLKCLSDRVEIWNTMRDHLVERNISVGSGGQVQRTQTSQRNPGPGNSFARSNTPSQARTPKGTKGKGKRKEGTVGQHQVRGVKAR